MNAGSEIDNTLALDGIACPLPACISQPQDVWHIVCFCEAVRPSHLDCQHHYQFHLKPENHKHRSRAYLVPGLSWKYRTCICVQAHAPKQHQQQQQHQALAEDEQCPDEALFKTRMCVYYQQGRCQRGSACSFAHDPSELQAYDPARRYTHQVP